MNKHKRKARYESLSNGVRRLPPEETANVFLDGKPIGSFGSVNFDMPHWYGRFDPLPAHLDAVILLRLETRWKLIDDDSLSDAEADRYDAELWEVQNEVDSRVEVRFGGEPVDFGYFKVIDGEYEFRHYRRLNLDNVCQA